MIIDRKKLDSTQSGHLDALLRGAVPVLLAKLGISGLSNSDLADAVDVAERIYLEIERRSR